MGLGSKHPHEQLVDNNRCATFISKHANPSDQRYTTIEWLARKASKPWLQLAKQLNCAGRAFCESQGGQSTKCADRRSKKTTHSQQTAQISKNRNYRVSHFLIAFQHREILNYRVWLASERGVWASYSPRGGKPSNNGVEYDCLTVVDWPAHN